MKVKTAQIITITVILCIFSTFVTLNAKSKSPDLDDSLKILENFTNRTWVGMWKNIRTGDQAETIVTFKTIWDGTAISYKIESPKRKLYGEGYFYYDFETKKVSLFMLYNQKILQRGTVSLQGNTLTIEGKISFPSRVIDYKNSFEFLSNGKMIDRWFSKSSGEWKPGHNIEFTTKD